MIFYDDFYSNYTDIPYVMKGMVSKFLKKMLHTVGVGRHSDEEVKNMMSHDMKMLSELLGMVTGMGVGNVTYI